MKKVPIAAILCLLAVLPLSAAEQPPPQKISIHLTDSPLDYVLKILAKSCSDSGVRLVYSQDVVKDREPVTINMEGDIDSVLLRILRPSGLEFVYTAESMAAIVPQASDAGMAKAGGRALRVFARLEGKLEGAVRVGDEVKVPDWTDEDDRALKEAFIDFLSAGAFFLDDMLTKPPDLARLLNSFDTDVRVGVCLPASRWAMRWSGSPDEQAALRAAVEKGLADPAAEVRAAAAFATLCLPRDQYWSRVMRGRLAEAARDTAPEVRFAAVLASSTAGSPAATPGGWPADPGMAAVRLLRDDPNAAVRGMAWLVWLKHRGSIPSSVAEFDRAILAEKHPVLRSLGAFWDRHNPEETARRYASAEVQGDALLKTAADVALVITEMRKAERAEQRDPQGPKDEVAQASTGQKAIDLAAGLLRSGKRSHEVLGCFCAILSMRAIFGYMGPVDASRLAELGDSASPWQRLIGIVASGAAGDPAARARFKEALQSPDHFDRCAAFTACTLSMERKKEGGAKAEPDPQFAKAMLACLKSPLFLDRKLAQLGAPQCVPFDDLAALFQDELRRDPSGERAKLLTDSFRFCSGLSGRDDLSKQRQMTILDAVLETKNAELQSRFFSMARWWFQGNDPLLLTAICECEPQALLAALGDRQYGHLWEPDFAARALLERLKAICESADPAVRLLAGRSLADFLSQRTVMVEQQLDPRPGILGKDEFRTASLAIVGRMLDDCIAKEDAGVDDERLAAGCGLLAAFVEGASRRGMGWDAMTPGIRAAAVRALGYAGRLVAGEELAGLAGVLWRITEGKDAELAPSLEAARKTIMAGGRPAEQLRLLREAAVFAEEPAIAELQRRFADPDSGFMSDAVSPEERLAGMRALRGSRAAMPDEFAAFLLTCLADTSADVQLRQEIHELLAERPERYGQLLDTLMALANACDGSLPIGKLVAPVRRALAAAEEQKQPRPAWTAKALDYGLAAMNNEELFPSQRAGAMELYAAVAGKDALPTLEAAAFGTGKNAEMRWRAVSAAIAADPGTNLLQKAAQEYGELPTEMRTSLLSIAATAAKTPGAEEFVILVLRDESIEWWRRTEMLRKLALPATPTLLAVLKELEKDKQIGPNAREAANRLRKPPLEKE